MKVFMNAEEKAKYLFSLYDRIYDEDETRFLDIVTRETCHSRADAELFWSLMDVAQDAVLSIEDSRQTSMK